MNTTGNNVKNGIKYLVEIPKSLKSVDPTGAHVKYWIIYVPKNIEIIMGLSVNG
ncbi:hypothetical protein [uncultured Methanobrevibacter sp.]|uniref:hypothetical protein n=1 Tax=uncultured Methanobrevibacter sp. TaxID=253161 RepID=UPI0025FD0C98|nr:hypothetical protein [uncultured Methanobrevibacter sp.]